VFELRGVSKAYGASLAVAPLDLTVAPGATTALIGPSGCGKSTILRLLLGLLAPDTGSIAFGGAPVTPATALRLRRRMGYVIQDGGLFPHLTARANACLMARWLGWERERCEARLRELAELTRFPAEALDRYPAQISGGQRQRVSLMRALMLDPEALLLDEPLGALDPMIRADLQQDLREVFARLKKTVVLVTHDLAEAAFLAQTVVLLREGRVVQQGPLAELMAAPADAFVSRFIQAQRSVS